MKTLPLEPKSLLVVTIVMGALCVYRAYDYWAAGFYVSDEYGYYYEASHGSTYGPRWFFGGLNALLFGLLRIDSPTGFGYLLPFYLFFWIALTVLAFYGVMKALDFHGMSVALSLFSSLFLVSYVLLSLGFLTEPVGLAVMMGGLFWTIRFLKLQGDRRLAYLVYPFLAALFFGAASGTREPYDIFLLGGIVFMPLLVLGKRQNLRRWGETQKRLLVFVSIFLFVGPSILFLQYPYNHLNEIQLRALGIGGTVVQPIQVTTVTTTTVSFSFSNFTYVVPTPVTETVTQVIVVSPNKTTTITLTRTFFTNATHTTTSSSAVSVQVTYTLLQNRLLNIFAIFFGGLLLGWGPILLGVAAIGFAILLSNGLRRRDTKAGLVTVLVMLALGSYFVVSYIFSTDPNYLSFRNYSTILRFSDTAPPAFLLTAPYGFAWIAKRKRYTAAFVASLVIFLVVAVPAYETFASSNLVSYTGGNPFSFNYRSDAVLVRDYLTTQGSTGNLYLIGVPPGWDFTPGTDTLLNTNVFTPFPGSVDRYLSYQDFISQRWTTFYLYAPVNLDLNLVQSQAPYLLQFIQPPTATGNSTAAYPFTVIDRQAVIQRPGFSLLKIQLAWR